MTRAVESEYCECGDGISFVGRFPPEVLALWREVHSGPGHEERVTPYDARRIRESLYGRQKKAKPK